ncbi:MAG TPA: DEAD/DEAH box helicase, partial [Alphaproteobacteria bacterium]
DVLATVPAKHQTLMFSATFAPAIIKFAQKYLNDPIRIEIAPERRTAENIEHAEIHCSDTERFAHLTEELKKREGSIIMFVKTKHGADRMAKRLTTTGHSADAIHGGLSQKQRDRAIAGFRNKKSRIMVATDVAARGLDVPHVEHVINYDLPQVAEDYVHRIGRTARAGAKGKALSLIMPADKGKWAAIQRILNPRPAGERGRDNDRRPGRANPNYNRPNTRPFQKRGPVRERKQDDFSIDPASLDLASSMERKFDRKPFGDKKSGERNYANKRPFGDKKPWGEKKSFGDKKPWGDKKEFGEKKPFGDKKPFAKKEWKKNGDKPTSTGFKKPFKQDGAKPFKKRPFSKGKPGNLRSRG